MSLDLVLEVGCEEIPHDLLEEGREALRAGLSEALEKARLTPATAVEALATPRRLAALVRGLPEGQPTVEETVQGPARKVAVDADGNPTKAGEGFARGQGVAFADLIEVETDKGVYVAARKTVPGRPAAEVLQTLLPEVLGGIHWAKAMRWGMGIGPFVRPVRWICAVLGGETVPFAFAGVHSGNRSRGHRFMAPGPFPVTGPEDYLGGLEEAKVLPDSGAREARIAEALEAAGREAGGQAVADPELVAVTAAKTEWPVAVRGGFDAKYLELPREVLITSMREHQDDFAVEGPDGRLLPAFVNFADNAAPDLSVVAHGNERVLRARLEDARFFFAEDQKRPLADYAERLDSFLFQKDLGSMRAKVRRVTALARDLAPGLGADPDLAARAAELCKCDLVTDMVYEFPELQGVMGRVYALASGEPEAVARAIEAHWLPVQAGGELPEAPEGRAVAIADKLDTLTGIFGVGLIPSGSQDPYALRRAGLAVVQMLMETPTGVDLDDALGRALAAYSSQGTELREDTAGPLGAFLRDRLGYALREAGLRYDVVEAALEAGTGDVHDAACRARALDALRRSDGSDDLMVSFRRVVKIIPDGFAPGAVTPERLATGPERDLWDAFAKSRDGITDRGRPAADRLAAMAALRPQVDAFFDAVLVMDPDEAVRAHRLSMLDEIRRTFRTFADFARVVVD
jgi:glycyl-tRNA synthetase beta chain